MARAGARVIVGLWIVLALGLLMATGRSRAAAATTDADNRARGLVQATVSTTVRFTLPTTASTAPPITSSASTTPTTKSPVTRPRVTGTTIPPTTPAPTTSTSTTVAPLPTVAPPPVTLPFATASQSGNINAFFPILGAFGLVAFAALVTAQWFLTKPGRKGPTL
jgi:hypothetical protein